MSPEETVFVEVVPHIGTCVSVATLSNFPRCGAIGVWTIVWHGYQKYLQAIALETSHHHVKLMGAGFFWQTLFISVIFSRISIVANLLL